jgi:site-specific DNA recombinase
VLISFDDDDAEIPTTMTAMFAAWERKQARKRTLRALREKARNGYATGGDCFGYTRVRCEGWVEYRINEEEAEVVRRIFRMYAAGHGPVAIAKALNGDLDYKEESKKFFNGERPEKSWAPSAIHAMLRNERYAGVLVYGRVKRGKYRDDGVQDRKPQRDAEAIFRAERPELRIVPAELWSAVQKRIAAEREAYLASTNGNPFGRPDVARAGRYLLSGLIRCGTCGGSMTANVQHSGRKARKRLVIVLCNRRNSRGKTACSNSLRIREEALNRHVVEALQIPTETIVAAARKALAKPKARSVNPERAIAKLEAEQARLVAAIRRGGPLDSLVQALQACEKSLRDAQAEKKPSRVAEPRLERDIRALATSWKRLLSLGLPEARETLRGLLNGPVVISPEKVGRWLLRGETLVKPQSWCRGRDSNPHSVATART